MSKDRHFTPNRPLENDKKFFLMTNYIKIQIKKRQNSHFPQII